MLEQNPLDAVWATSPAPPVPVTATPQNAAQSPEENPLDAVWDPAQSSQTPQVSQPAQAQSEPNPLDAIWSHAPQSPASAPVPTATQKPKSLANDLIDQFRPQIKDLANIVDYFTPGKKPEVQPENPLDAVWNSPKNAAAVAAAQPDSTWDKVKSFATHPLAIFGSAEEMVPTILGTVAKHELADSGHPVLAKIASAYTGVSKAESETVRDMTSPLNLGIMAATGGLGAVEDVAASTAARLGLSKEAIAVAAKYGPQVARLVNAGFSIDGLRRAYQNLPEIKKAFDKGDTQEVARLLTSTATTVGMSTMAGLHSLGSVKPTGATGKAEAESLQNAPVAKLVDSDAAKLHEEEQTTAPVEKVKPETEPQKGNEKAKLGVHPDVQTGEKEAQAPLPRITPLPEGAEKFDASNVKGTTKEAYTEGTPQHDERVALQDKIKSEFLDRAKPVQEGEQPVAYILGGGTASGKSTLEKLLSDRDPNTVLANTDAIKNRLPEYREWQKSDPQNASKRVHDEASGITKDVVKAASDQNKNIIVDSTTAGGDDAARIQDLKDKGYRIELHFVDIPTDLAQVREDFRYKNSLDENNRGRKTQPEDIERTHQKAAENFFKLKDSADAATFWDNTDRAKGFQKVSERVGNSPEIVYNEDRLNEYTGKANGDETRLGADTPAGRRLQEAIQREVRVGGETLRDRGIQDNPQALRGTEDQLGNADSQGSGTAKVVTDDHVPVVSKDSILSEATQRIINNSSVLQQVVDPAKIQTPEDVTIALNEATKHIETKLDPRVGTRISLDAQKQLASDLGMPVAELLNRQSGAAYSAERAIAARAMLKQSADNIVELARKAATDETAKPELAMAMARHQEIANQVAGITSEAGRALGSFRVKGDDLPAVKIADVMSQLNPDALAEATKLLTKIDPSSQDYVRKVNQFVREVKPATTADKLFELYRNSLLSGPATVIKKGISEAAMMALEATKKAMVGGLESLKSATGVSKSPEAFASEGYWYAKGAAQALTHMREILSGEFNLADAPGFEHGGQSAIKGRIGQLVRIPSEIIGKQTNLVYAMNYFGELNALAARQAISEGLEGEALAARQEYLAHNPTKEMTTAANEMGLHNTFQSELGRTGKAASGLIQSNPVSRFLFPFFKTPVNLVKASGEFSPYGLFKGTAQGDLGLQAKGLLGSSIAAGIAHLAMNGLITGGGPINFKQRETKEATGWQPYSVKVGGKYYSYRNGEPLGLVLGLVADAIHGQMKDEDPAISNSKTANALNHVTRNVSNLPFLMQLGNIVDSLTHLGQGNTVERVIDNLLASAVIPAGVKNVAQTLDTTSRGPQHEGWSDPTKGLVQTIEERTPGLTKNVPADIDVTGQPVQKPVSGLGGANPFPVSTEKNNPVVAELARLGVTVENAPTGPVTVKGVGRKKFAVPGTTPTPDEAVKIQQLETRDFFTLASRAVSNPQWKAVPDDEKKIILNKLHAAVTKSRLQRLQQIRQQPSE
jgi:predicted ABC-type ATPase